MRQYIRVRGNVISHKSWGGWANLKKRSLKPNCRSEIDWEGLLKGKACREYRTYVQMEIDTSGTRKLAKDKDIFLRGLSARVRSSEPFIQDLKAAGDFRKGMKGQRLGGKGP